MRGWTFMFHLLFICLVSIPAYAQKESGAILGHVRDAEGEAIPGATISASNLTMVGWISTAYTAQNGYYRLSALPPGLYEIKAELAGFQTIIRKDVRLFVGKSITVDFTLDLQPISETIEVSADAPVLDVTTPATPATLPWEFVENLPKSFSGVDLFNLTPGVVDDVAYGAGGPQANAYWLDGVDISEPVFGYILQSPNYNWIQEVQVVGLGAPAEYGGFMGVVSNVVTRSGGNEFHGLFETFFQNNSLTAANTDNPDLKPSSVDLFTDSSVQAGGPILRDRLWFFSGFGYDYSRSVPFGYPPYGNEAFVTSEEPEFIGKLTYRLNQDNHLQGFLEYEGSHATGVGAGAFRLPEATWNDDSTIWTWNLGWVSILGPDTLLDVRTSGFDFTLDSLPREPGVPGHIELSTGLRSVNAGFTFQSDGARSQVNASVSHHASDFLAGDHDFKFGVQYEHSSAHQMGGYTGGALYYDLYEAPYSRYLWAGYDFNSNIDHLSTFVQDIWSVSDQLKLSLGIRLDHNRVSQAKIQMTTNPVAPRIGLVYDLAGNQKTVFKAHYGHYYQSATTWFVDQTGLAGDLILEYFDPELQQWVRDPDDVTVALREEIEDKIKAQYTEQFTAGVDQQLPGDLVVGAHYIYRRDNDLIEDVEVLGIYEPFEWKNPLTDEMMTLYRRLNPGEDRYVFMNPPEAYRQYHALQLTGSKRFSGNFLMTGSLVISRARGNLDNRYGFASTGWSRQFDSPNLNINFDGRLGNDSTYEIKLMGYYDLPWGISTSAYFRHFSGETWTPTYNVSRDVGEFGILVFLLPRGSYRLPGRNNLDWRMEKSFPLGAGSLKFTMDMFNVFNSGYVTRVEERFDRQTYGESTRFSGPREVRLGIRYQF